MGNDTTALDLDTLDEAVDSSVHQRRSAALGSEGASNRQQRLLSALGAVVLTPLIVLALSVLALVLLSRLLVELVAAGFER
jgi:hypothetical protein